MNFLIRLLTKFNEGLLAFTLIEIYKKFLLSHLQQSFITKTNASFRRIHWRQYEITDYLYSFIDKNNNSYKINFKDF